jgi:hypothetical protein
VGKICPQHQNGTFMVANGETKKGCNGFKLENACKCLLAGSNITVLVCAEGLIESLVLHWVRNIKNLTKSVGVV